MKLNLIILSILLINFNAISQDTIPFDSFPQPKEIKEIYSRSDLEVTEIVAFHVNPDVLVYKRNGTALYLAVVEEYNFEIGQDDWIIWELPIQGYNIDFLTIDTVQIDKIGKPEIVIKWRHDEAFGGGWYGGHHIIGTQIWNIDTPTLLLDMINHEDYTENENDSVNIKITVEYSNCDQELEISNGGLRIGEVEGENCDSSEDYGFQNLFSEGFYLFQDDAWVRQ